MKIVPLLCLVHLSGYGYSYSSIQKRSVTDWSFRLYTSQTTSSGTTDLSQANPSNPTIFIIHGWKQSGVQPWIIQLKDKYISLYAINVIIFDWSADSYSDIYFPSANAVPTVGNYVGTIIYQLCANTTINVNSAKVIGFSLGAHVAGYAGKKYQTLSGGIKLPIIVGLEAAAMGFNNKLPTGRLDKSDAVIVQAFHTSTTGITFSYGTHDIYFNTKPSSGCGKSQPGCPNFPGVPNPTGSSLPSVYCDHIRGAAYFIESVGSLNLIAVLCNCNNFNNNACLITTSIVVGDSLSLTAANGDYYLATRCISPFALGSAGLQGSASNYNC